MHKKKSGLTLMELLVVVVIIGILIAFGVVAVNLMNKEYTQRKLAPSVYSKLNIAVGEVMARTANPEPIMDNGFIANEKLLPPFNTADGGFCNAVTRVMNLRRNRVNCADAGYSFNGDGIINETATGTADLGGGMFISGLSNRKTCWNGKECLHVFVSISKFEGGAHDGAPRFASRGTLNKDGEIVPLAGQGPVDHFGFNIYRDGFVEPMMTEVGGALTPYGVAAEAVNVNVIVDSVDQIFNENPTVLPDGTIQRYPRLVSLFQLLDANVPTNSARGDQALRFHNSENFDFFTTTNGNGRNRHSLASSAANFVLRPQGGNPDFCEFGLACRIGFERNRLQFNEDENGVFSAESVVVPDFRRKQLNDANVVYFKVPYRRALDIKNYIEDQSYRFNVVNGDICLTDNNCLQRRISSLKEYDMGFDNGRYSKQRIDDQGNTVTVSSIGNGNTNAAQTYRAYYDTFHRSFYDAATNLYICQNNGLPCDYNRREAMRLVRISLR